MKTYQTIEQRFAETLQRLPDYPTLRVWVLDFDVDSSVGYLTDGGEGDDHEIFHHESAVDAVQSGILRLCICGNPLGNIHYVARGLRHVEHYTNSFLADEAAASKDPSLDGLSIYDIWRKRGAELFGSEDGEQFFYYWADNAGFTEHGGSIPGWLSDAGKEFLDFYEKHIKTLQSEDL